VDEAAAVSCGGQSYRRERASTDCDQSESQDGPANRERCPRIGSWAVCFSETASARAKAARVIFKIAQPIRCLPWLQAATALTRPTGRSPGLANLLSLWNTERSRTLERCRRPPKLRLTV